MRTNRLLVLAVLGGGLASATPVVWKLNSVLVADGTVITGTFVFDADTTTFSLLSITTSGGSSVPATSAWVFNTNNAGCEANTAGDSGFCAVDALSGNETGAHDVSLFDTGGPVMTNAGGTLNLSFVRVGTCLDATCQTLTTPDSLTGSGQFVSLGALPEPATWFGVCAGLLLMWAGKRFRPGTSR